MVKAITFDLDGVYFPDGKAVFLDKLVELGVLRAEAEQVFLKSTEMNGRYKNGQMTDDQYWQWAASQWKLDKSPRELMSILIESYSVDAAVAQTVRTVRLHGYKTLICSNNFPARVDGLQKRFGFLDDFDATVFSYQVGVSKPSKAIFRELINRSTVEAEAIVFADDAAANLTGAKQLGITTFLYEGFDSFLATLKALGVRV